jgi:hypothetical protein
MTDPELAEAPAHEKDDPLADLQPKAREAKIKARLLELADSILAARKRGVALTDIVKRLARLKKGRLKVSSDYLNEVMAQYHGEAWPKPKPRARSADGTRNGADATVDGAKGGARSDSAAPTTVKVEGQAQDSIADSEPNTARPVKAAMDVEPHLDAFEKRVLPTEL